MTMNGNYPKRLGPITVLPNEYVVHTRRGEIRTRGVGKSFFCVPWTDSFLIFSVTAQRVSFQADNITQEKQGINIDGFMIWSVDNGDLTYKKLSGRAADPLTELSEQLRDICTSVVRHSIAHSTIEQAITERERFGTELKKQLDAIVADWGIKIETIEIKDVKVLSNTLFQNMQAPFRNQQRRVAELSNLEARQDIESATANTNTEIRGRQAEQETLAHRTEGEQAEKRKIWDHEAARRDGERAHQLVLGQLENEQATERRRRELAQQAAILELELRHRQALRQQELQRDAALAERDTAHVLEETHRVQVEEEAQTHRLATEHQGRHARLEKESEVLLKDMDLALQRREQEQALAFRLRADEMDNALQEPALRRRALDRLGDFFRGVGFQKIHWVGLGGDTPMSGISRAFAEILALWKTMGTVPEAAAAAAAPASPPVAEE